MFVVVALLGDELIVSSVFADSPVSEEVSKKLRAKRISNGRREKARERSYMQSAFWMVDSRCAMAMVVRPLAALSNASCTTFSELESRAEVACTNHGSATAFTQGI